MTRNLLEFGTSVRSVWNFGGFYSHPLVDQLATKPSTRLSPSTLLFTTNSQAGDPSYLLKSAQYLQTELPIRLAHRIVSFRTLPFIIAINHQLVAVQERYIKSFYAVHRFPKITDLQGKLEFVRLMDELMAEHRDNVHLLASGMRETRHIIKQVPDHAKVVNSFLNSLLTARLGIRILAENLVALHNPCADHVGIINIEFSPGQVVEKRAEFARRMVQAKYGWAPVVRVEGDVGATFPYIQPPFEYLVGELLKNAMRATVEHHMAEGEQGAESAPPILVQVLLNDREFFVRISDQGGGIPHKIQPHIWDYGYSTLELEEGQQEEDAEVPAWTWTHRTAPLSATVSAGLHTVPSHSHSHSSSTPEEGDSNQVNTRAAGAPGSSACPNGKTSSSAATRPVNVNGNGNNPFKAMTDSERVTGIVAGYGFGLPMARAFAEYLGGSLQLVTMPGLRAHRNGRTQPSTGSTDVYLRLPFIHNPEIPSFRI